MKTTNLRLFLSVIISFTSLSVYCQENFIEFTNQSGEKLNINQKKQLEKIKSIKFYKNEKIIKLNALEKSLKSNELDLKLPLYDCELTYVYKSSIFNSKDDYSWYGEIKKNEKTECSFGSIHYVRKKEKTFGQIEVGNDTYEFIDIGDGKHIFYQIDEYSSHQLSCSVNHKKTPEIQTKRQVSVTENQRIYCPNDNTVSILVLYTPSAANSVSNIHTTAQLSISQVQQALSNSQIAPSKLQVELVNVLPLNFIETGNIATDVDSLSVNTIANNLRTQHQADLVVLLTSDAYYMFSGIAKAIGPIFTDAYAIVEANTATSYKVFAHEVGHLFGGMHHNDPNGSIEHGHIFQSWFLGKIRGTILATMQALKGKPKRRILYYSNPEVYYNNQSTGTSHHNDNETKFETTGPIISQFFPNAMPDFTVSINGPYSVCINQMAEFEANITCGESPHSILWEKSYDGINWTSVGSNEYYTYYEPTITQYTTLSLRLTVTDNTGVSITTQQNIILRGTGPGGMDCIGYERIANANEIIANVYPNPLTKSSSLEVLLDKEYEKLSVNLFDSFGNILLQKEFLKPDKNISIQLNNTQVKSAGSYYLQIVSESSKRTIPIIIK